MLMVDAWRDLGHEVFCFAIEERGPGLMEYKGTLVALPYHDPFGTDVIPHLCRHLSVDAVISLFDPWVLHGNGYEIDGIPWFGWFPVDQDKGLPYNLGEKIKYMQRPVVYSQYAAERVPGAAVIAPPINLDVFTPADKAEAKKHLGMFDYKVIGIVGSNMIGDRKALEVQITAFAEFAKSRNDVKLLVVAPPFGTVNLIELVNKLDAKDRVTFVDDIGRNYLLSNNRSLAEIYNSFDVLLHASAAEGFGMCIAEALACCVPVIYADNTSQPEVSGGFGYAVTDMDTKPNPHGGQWDYPTKAGVMDALERWYSGSKTFDIGEMRIHAMQYNAQAAAAAWEAVINGY